MKDEMPGACIVAVGEDGKTRGWSQRSGALLCSVPAPQPVSDRALIPRIAYSNTWGGLNGNAALILGVANDLCCHELRL